MNRNLFQLLLLPAVAVVSACGDGPSDPSKPQTSYGEAVAVGQGTARSYVVFEDDVAVEIGIALSEGALEGLPPGSGPMDSRSYDLPLPANHGTGFQLVELDWNPGGHPPPMVYTVPHFDFHFYTIPVAARNAILPTDPQFATKAANLPAEGQRPAGYAVDAAPGGAIVAVPEMGVHWSDRTSHEFHGSPFTSTFILGSWDGDFIFLEPMVELAFLKSKPDFRKTVAVPSSFGSPGDRPSGYRVGWYAEAKEYRIGLTELGD